MTVNLKQPEKPHGNDAALVRAFNAGQKDAFDLLVLRHKDRIFNLCIMYLGDYQEANDISQEIFIKVFRSLGGFKFKSAFSTWLYRIAVNTCKNRIKSLEFRFKKRMRRLYHPGISQSNNPSTGIATEIADESGSPLDRLEKKERAIRVRQAINALPDEKKTMIILRDIEDFSYAEICAITGLKPGTVKSRLARARLTLKEKLKGVL